MYDEFTIPKASKIVITRHAQKRFLERFRLYFSNTKISSRYMWDNLMIAQVSQGNVCRNWRMCPFYVNKHGSKTVVIKRSPCYYIGKKNADKLVIVTVVPRWYND